MPEENAEKLNAKKQLDLFENNSEDPVITEEEKKDKKRQMAIIELKKKFGRNTIIKASDLEEGATAMERNRQVGGHNA